MSCESVDLKAYVLGEGTREERGAVKAHALACAECRDELSRLEMTQAALFSLRDEEIPRRIAFVSDRVVSPGWWQLWHMLPHGLSAAPVIAGLLVALGAALAVPLLRSPAPILVQLAAPAAPRAETAAGTPAVTQKAIDDAVAKAVSVVEQRQQQRTAELLAAADKKHDLDLRVMQAAFEEDWKLKMRQLGNLYVAVNRMNDGAAQ